MAQEPDRLTADDSEAGSPTPAEIERDIERTRADMTETIDALGARFEPSYLKEQAQEAIVDTARSAGTSMIDTLKDNPLPAAIAGLSIAWLFANRSSGSHSRSRAAQDGRYAAYGDYSGGYGASAGYRATSGGTSNGPSLVDKARGAASGLTDSVTGTASDLAEQARMTAHDVTSGAQDAAQRAETWLEGQIQSNPLGVGAVALAAGALVGLSLPTTEAESNLMRAPATRLVEQAKDAASGPLDQAKEVAAKVAGEVKDKAAEVIETAKSEAQNLASSAGSGGSADDDGPGGGPSGAPQAGAHTS
ncbi:MAG TPA: DUF3618 domain-containing protein [Rubricoccaceae bacterium]|jgi:hypothetical protein